MTNINDFFKISTVIDTETTDIDVNKAEIVEVASGRLLDNNEWETKELMFGTNQPIPPEASAIHHISDKMIEGLPVFLDNLTAAADCLDLDTTEYYIAHNSEFDRRILEAWFKHNNDTLAQFQSKKWICTWKLAKVILGVDYDRLKYNLGFLRYYLDLDVDSDLPAHRAQADVITCGRLIEKLIILGVENGTLDSRLDIGEQLYDVSWRPLYLSRFPFGKHKGQLLSEIPDGYYLWAVENMDVFDENNEKYNADLAYSVEKILIERSLI